MHHFLAHTIASPLARLWLAQSPSSWRLLPVPAGAPSAHSAGINSDRVALIGSGIAVGYGVRSSDLALGGHLARQLSALTRRGTFVDIMAAPTMTVTGCVAALETLDLSRYDAAVMTLGSDEALRLVPARRFRRDLEQLLTYIEESAPLSLNFVFVALPAIPSIKKLPSVYGRLVGRQCRRFNAQLRIACAAHPRVTHLPFEPAPGNLLNDAGRRTYDRWSALIAPEVARVLDAQALEPPHADLTLQPHRKDLTHEPERQHALDELHILDSAPEERFDRIVASARNLFGVAGASITFIDHERQWTKAAVGMGAIDSPRGSALCDTTICGDDVFVVEDTGLDARFMGHPWVAGIPHARFFAGYPIEAPDGYRVGALCVVHTSPRTFSAKDGSLLRELAMQVQAELWGTAAAVRGTHRLSR
ncbi:MAG: diguanylate cyclase [Microbacteriaceae bacterium]|nr:diguanylate cyclase [Microbacteriaceae bacterium]